MIALAIHSDGKVFNDISAFWTFVISIFLSFGHFGLIDSYDTVFYTITSHLFIYLSVYLSIYLLMIVLHRRECSYFGSRLCAI